MLICCVLCCLCCYCYFVRVDHLRFVSGDLQRVGLQGPDKEAPTSHRISRINNEPSRPTEGVRFCLSERSIPFHQQVLFESNKLHSATKHGSSGQRACWPWLRSKTAAAAAAYSSSSLRGRRS